MNEMLADNPFRHVLTRDAVVGAFLAVVYSHFLPGGENSVVLQNQLRDRSSASVQDAEEWDDEEFLADCQAAVSLANQLLTGEIGTPSAEILALAKQAVEGCEARKTEDFQGLAERLARDVGQATD